MPSRDFLTEQGGLGKPGFSVSGGQYGEPGAEHNGKTPTTLAPMIINNHHAGEMAGDDDLWKTTFGSSLDAFLSLMSGRKLQETINNMTLTGIFKDGVTNADDDNIFKKANDTQQIHYVVSGQTADEGLEAHDDFGAVENARGLSFRMPAIVTGWGRKVNLIPTDPAPGDDENLRKNDDAHKLDRSTWKTGPLDLRWNPSRGVWSAFNDMIADHNQLNMGTWIFGTNNDTSVGFPFIRGRLEDVFWVRQTPSQDGTSPHNDDVQTGEVLTHLNHRWYDDEEKGAAKLSSIFIIPNKNESGDCHDAAGSTKQAGDEETGECERIDIKTSVHFFATNEFDGSLAFCETEATEFLAPYVSDGKYIRGELIFDSDNCKWIPAILFDECEYVAGHVKKLIENDGRIAVRLSAMCNEIAQTTQDIVGVTNSNDANLSSAIACLQDELNGTIKTSINSALSALGIGIGLEIQTVTDAIVENVNIAFAELVASIELALGECGCVATIPVPQVSSTHGNDVISSVTWDINCPANLENAVEYDCDQCVPVKLQGPCMTQPEYSVGEPCGGAVEPNVQTIYGRNQFHDPEPPGEVIKTPRPPCGEELGEALQVG